MSSILKWYSDPVQTVTAKPGLIAKREVLYGCRKQKSPRCIKCLGLFAFYGKSFFMESYTVYINYSEKFDKYYIGQTEILNPGYCFYNSELVKSTYGWKD